MILAIGHDVFSAVGIVLQERNGPNRVHTCVEGDDHRSPRGVADQALICARMLHTLPAGFVAPCLPTKTDKLPSGSDWLHEIKHDGFRIIARKKGAQVRLYSRPGNDLTRRFPLIVETLARLRSRSCIIDGEAVACDDNGVASFDLVRHQRANDRVFLCWPAALCIYTLRRRNPAPEVARPQASSPSSWSAAVITTVGYVLCSTGFHKWAERRSCKQVWEAAARSLEACKDVLVGYVDRGDIVRANNLHHSRRWVWCAGDENGNVAIAKCVDEKPYLPTVGDAHEDGFKIFARTYPRQSVGMLANGSVRWKLIQNAIFEKRYRIISNPRRPR
jgi:ATP dependent DNA ligase domain